MCVCAPIAAPELRSKHAADVPDVYINYPQLAGLFFINRVLEFIY